MSTSGHSWQRARLRSVRDLTADVRLFEIEPSGAFIAPTPGSHIKVAVQIEGRPEVRSYSTVGLSADHIYRIAVKRAPISRGGSAYMWRLQHDALLTISAPDNHFPLSHGCRDYVLVAGGIGITPIHSMALALAQTNASFRVLYACRSAADAALADELRTVIGDRLVLVLDDAGMRIDFEAEIARLAPAGECYVCGPIGMLEAAKAAWQRSGRSAAGLRYETFGNSGRFASEAFRVKIPRLGLDLDVPANRSLLDVLEAAGVGMIADCRRGECGLCVLPICSVNGIVDHRDVFFSDEEKAANARLCTCVSRVVNGSITLDTGHR
jgi:vanillate O-demethylase ferredoxin subunit